jgi:Rhs element Vgr protein
MAVVTATVLSEGKEIDDVYALLSIDIRREVNRIPYASLVFQDGDVTEGSFDLSNATHFEPGKEIEVKLRYESETPDSTVFKGLVVRHGVEASARGSLLRVEIKDAAVKLTQTRKCAVYVDQDDAEVIDKLIKDSGLKSGKIDATKLKYAQNVQYYCTDWDYIVSRAESQGLLAVADDGEISVRKTEISGEPRHSFDYGSSEIYDFDFELDAGSQYSAVLSSGWDVKQLKLTAETNAKAFALQQGDLDGASLAKAVGFESYQLKYPAPLVPEELQAWADGQLMRSRLSMIRGRLATAGIPDIKLFDVIEIDGIGTRFNGKTLVTGISHSVDTDGWRTDIQFGLSARRFAREDAIREIPAAGLLPGISGLHIAVVDSFEKDPDQQFRVKVILPGIDEKTGSVWARLAAPDAGKNRGWFFRPQTGDEVVVGFFNNDPRQPVILGGMYSSKNTPPEDFSEITEKNETRGIVTRTGTVIGFVDDEKGSVYIETAEGAKVLLDDNAKSMELSDQNGNQLKMDKDGITLKSAKDLKLEASGNVEIKGAKVDVK